MSKQKIQLSDHFDYSRLLRFVLPCVGTMLFTSIYGIVDGLCVSNFVGKTAFAAVNLIMPAAHARRLASASCWAPAAAPSWASRWARATGEKADRTISASSSGRPLRLGIVLSAPSAWSSSSARRRRCWAQRGSCWTTPLRYGRILMLVSLPPFALAEHVPKLFRHRRKAPLWASAFTVGAGCTNMVLDVVMVGMLHWGVEGAAIATLISQLVGGVLPVFYFLNKRSTSSIHLGRAQWNGGVIRSACINGSSELMTNLSMSLVNILYNYQLLRFAGENGVAAYGVIMYAAFLFVAVFVGYAVGSAPIVSYHYGARNHAELNNLYSKSLRLIGVIAVVMTALSMLVIPYVARIFVGYDAELLALTSHAFRVYALNFFLMGFNVYGSSFFTALGDGVTSALISFLRTLLFQLLALIFLPMVLGIEGVWLAVTAAEAGALCVTVLMFITKDKVFHYRKVSC